MSLHFMVRLFEIYILLSLNVSNHMNFKWYLLVSDVENDFIHNLFRLNIFQK